MPLAPGTRIGPYEVVEMLGAGGMGEVYRARDPRLNRDVALKVLPGILSEDPTRMQRFEREAQLLASLNHPNIATLHGVEDSEGGRALVMELVEGGTLADRTAAGPLPVDEALAYARQIADALEAAHDKGIIHRDLKPANVKVTPDGKVKVLDFGLAKALADEPAHSSVANSPTMSLAATRVGMILGTAAYMSPEQAKGKSADRRADIWSFGVVVAEMLSGRQMYSGETAAETLAHVITKDPVIPPDVPTRVAALLRRCLEKDPRRRLQAIGEARLMLEDSWGGSPEPRPASILMPAALAATLIAFLALAYIHFREQPPVALTTRFHVLPPDKSRNLDFPTISPNGRKLAFVSAVDGKRLLWIRPLDSLDAEPLAGTDEAGFPFWSPDSRFVGFFASGKLKKVDVTGGPPQTLCDAANPPRGGAWNRDGVILFAAANRGALMRVSSSGGIPSVATAFDPKTEVSHRWPHYLPGGKQFLYSMTAQKNDDSAVLLGSLDDSPTSTVRRRVLLGGTMAMWSAGHLVFSRDGTLMAQPFDLRALQLTGEPFPVAQRIGMIAGMGGYSAFSTSPDGTLAYRLGGAGVSQLAWFDRTGKELDQVGRPDNHASPRLSPDGKRVAITRTDPTGDIWLLELGRDAATRFTFHPQVDMVSVWSPDGSRIAFSSNRSGTQDLYMKPANGAGEDELLLKTPFGKFIGDWSPDGRHLVYSVLAEKTGVDLWALPVDGARTPFPVVQTEGDQNLSQFSPDGRWLTYQSTESGQVQIFAQAFPKAAGKFQVSTGGGYRPRWSRNGREIFYMNMERKLMAVDVKATATTFEAGRPKELFQTRAVTGPPFIHSFDVSADGQRFLINTNPDMGSPTPMTVVINWAAQKK